MPSSANCFSTIGASFVAAALRLGGQLAAELLELIREWGNLVRQCREVAAGALQLGDLVADLGAILERRGDGVAVLVEHPLDGVQPVVHLGQLRRVQIELVEVAAQVKRGVFELDRRIAHRVGDGPHVSIEQAELDEHGRHHLEALQDRAFRFIQRRVGCAGVLLQLLEVHQD
jgi:hypothetical protein